MTEKKKTFLEGRIEAFCDSSAELLTGIHAKYSGGKQGKSKRKRKRKKKNDDIFTIPDVSIDVNDDEPVEGLL